MKFTTYGILFILQVNLCWNREKYSPVNDFLLHEAGNPIPYDKNNNVQFPTLKPPSSAPTFTTKVNSPPNNKRDYVSQFPALKPVTPSTANITPKPINPSAKRDYVAPQNPTTKTSTTIINNVWTSTKTTSYPKRDYVAPAFTTLKPVNNNNQAGKVKDLINFYDSKSNQGTPVPPKAPSYSSILKGSTSPTVSPLPSYTVPNKPTSLTSKTTHQITNNVKPTSPSPSVQTGGNLPSSILNTNKNQGSTSSSDAELQALSEELLKKDTNNAAKYVTINYQEKTTSQAKEDKAPQPLLNISPEVWNIPTIQKFVPLLDNYERDTLVNEYVTAQERTEENAFMDAVMSTTVIRHLMNYLKDKGYVGPDPRQQRDFLKQIWFGLYSRGKGKISSSGFEHIFVSELKNDQISGLHNWIYFSKEEAANRVNYLGYMKYTNLSDKGAVLKMHFNQQGVDKPVGTMFIGTSPELEMALYTLCYVTRVDNDCKLKLGNNEVNILTHNFRYRSKNYIGSAYPQI